MKVKGKLTKPEMRYFFKTKLCPKRLKLEIRSSLAGKITSLGYFNWNAEKREKAAGQENRDSRFLQS